MPKAVKITDEMVAIANVACDAIEQAGRYDETARQAVLAGFTPWIAKGLSANDMAEHTGRGVKTAQGKIVAPGNIALRYRWATLHVKVDQMEDGANKVAAKAIVEPADVLPDAQLREYLADSRDALVDIGLANAAGRRKAEKSEADKAVAWLIPMLKRINKANLAPTTSGANVIPAFNATALSMMYLTEGITDGPTLAKSYTVATPPASKPAQETPSIPTGVPTESKASKVKRSNVKRSKAA